MFWKKRQSEKQAQPKAAHKVETPAQQPPPIPFEVTEFERERAAALEAGASEVDAAEHAQMVIDYYARLIAWDKLISTNILNDLKHFLTFRSGVRDGDKSSDLISGMISYNYFNKPTSTDVDNSHYWGRRINMLEFSICNISFDLFECNPSLFVEQYQPIFADRNFYICHSRGRFSYRDALVSRVPMIEFCKAVVLTLDDMRRIDRTVNIEIIESNARGQLGGQKRVPLPVLNMFKKPE